MNQTNNDCWVTLARAEARASVRPQTESARGPGRRGHVDEANRGTVSATGNLGGRAGTLGTLRAPPGRHPGVAVIASPHIEVHTHTHTHVSPWHFDVRSSTFGCVQIGVSV